MQWQALTVLVFSSVAYAQERETNDRKEESSFRLDSEPG